jgi:hypothetical protein
LPWIAAGALAALGLLPQTLGGITAGAPGVLRVTIIEPLALIAVCLAIVLASPEAVDRLIDRGAAAVRAPSSTMWCAAVATLAFGLSAGFSWYCFGRQPVLTDEFSQLFQASVLLEGRLSARAETLPEFFNTAQTAVVNGRWFSEFPIGGPVLLAFARIVRGEWLLGPALAALSALILFRAVRRSHGEMAARVTTLLFALSPFVLFMSASRMNHSMALASQLVALYGLSRWDTASGKSAHLSGATIGAGLGALSTFRPYDAALLALPIGVFQLARLRVDRSKGRSLMVQVSVGLLFVGALLAVNALTTGNPLVFGYDVVNGPSHRPGFHVNPMGRPFTPAVGLSIVSVYLTSLNVALLETAVPALVFVCATLILLGRPTRWDYLHIGIIAVTLVGYGAYWFNGQFVGPRFLFPAVPSFLLFIARLGSAAGETLRPGATMRRLAPLLATVSVALAWTPVAMASRPTGVWLRAYAHRQTQEARQPDLAASIRDAALSNALVFVREPLHNRFAARLRALGMPPYRAERVAADLDACALLEGLDTVDRLSLTSQAAIDTILSRARAAGPASPVRGLLGARSLALVAGKPSEGGCASEISADSGGTVTYDAFLARATLDSAGRLGGAVVFARDLGRRNELLRSRFGDRLWMRYRPATVQRPAAFLPY